MAQYMQQQSANIPDSRLDPAMRFIESALEPEGDPVERFLVMQRIQDILKIFPNGNINPWHDFANQSCLRCINLWDGANAYRAVASWMVAVGPSRYGRYTAGVKAAGHKAVQEFTKRVNAHDLEMQGYQTSTASTSGCGQGFASPFAGVMTSLPSMSILLQGLPGDQPPADNQSKHQPIVDVSLIRALLYEDDNGWKGHIRTYGQYKAHREAYVGMNNEVKPDDPTTELPENDPSFQTYIEKLYKSMLSMNDILENPRLLTQSRDKKRKVTEAPGQIGNRDDVDTPWKLCDSAAVRSIKKLRSLELELLCWEVLEEAWNHQNGQFDIPPWYEPTYRKRKEYASFVQRLDECCEQLRYSKNSVRNMLNISFAKRFALDPYHEVQRKVLTKKGNAKRDLEIKAGVHAQQAGFVIVDPNDRSIRDASGQQISPANPLYSRVTRESAKKAAERQPGGRVRVQESEGGRSGSFDLSDSNSDHATVMAGTGSHAESPDVCSQYAHA